MSVKIICTECGNKFWDSVTLESESNKMCPQCDHDVETEIEEEEEELPL